MRLYCIIGINITLQLLPLTQRGHPARPTCQHHDAMVILGELRDTGIAKDTE